MKTMTLKGLFLCLVFLLCNATSHAADDLITRQVTIKLDKAGTLPDKIGSSRKYKITNLKIVGEINGTDWRLIRDMAGRDFDRTETSGELSVLDLSEAKIVSGGSRYDAHTFRSTPNNCIGENAFVFCSGLTSITLPSGVTSIGGAAFEDCRGLTSLTIPSGVTSINESAFEDCSGLTSLAIPSSVTLIDDYAFRGCCGLTSLALPSSVTLIDDYAFAYCSGLTSIYVYPEKVPILRKDTFSGCDAKNCTVYVPTGTYDDYWLSDFGYFENIVEFDATGIDKVTTSNDAKELSRYSVNGQRLSAPTKGLNIVKYSDGSVKKVAVQ